MRKYVIFFIAVTCTLTLLDIYSEELDVKFFASKIGVAIIERVVIVIACIFLLFNIYKQIDSEIKWKDASDIYKVQAYKECLDDFELAYPMLKNNGVFMVQYGKALNMAGKHKKAIEILGQAKHSLSNTILYTAMGDSYKALGKNNKAEQAYLHAWHMIPSRFYPLYLLANLYDETGQTSKALAMANQVIDKEVKIPSTAIDETKAEMQKIITKNKIPQTSNKPEEKRQEANTKIQTASCLPASPKKGREVIRQR